MGAEPKMLLVLAGISGCGKTYLTNALAGERDFAIIPSLTTRQPRPEETEAKDRRFCSPEAFEKLRTEQRIICGRFFFGNWYGLDTESIDDAIFRDDAVVQLTYKSLSILKARYPQAKAVYILPPSLETAKHAVMARNLNAEETAERIQEIEAESVFISADRASGQPLFDRYFHNTRVPGTTKEFFAQINALRR